MMIGLLYFFVAANYAHSFALPSIGFHSIKSWDDVSEPPDKAGRRYGPNWSVDDNLEPKATPGQTGAMVWSIPFNSSYVYPEMRPDLPVGKLLRSRPNLGICMSGGGMRAATCALGWYRALNHLNLLQKARFLSGNSGATWTSLPLTCRSLLQKKELGTDIDLDDYLGKYEGKYDDISVEERSLIGKNLAEANMLDPKVNGTISGFNAWSTGAFCILDAICLLYILFIFILIKMSIVISNQSCGQVFCSSFHGHQKWLGLQERLLAGSF